MDFRKILQVSFTKERMTARNEVISMLSEIEQLEVVVERIDLNVKTLKGKKLEETKTIKELKVELTRISNGIAETGSNISNILKSMIFLKELSQRVKDNKLSQKIFSEFSTELTKKYPTSTEIRDKLDELCKKLHKILSAKITIRKKMKQDVGRLITALNGALVKLEAIQ